MPFQILDFILLGIMLISGLLALTRGFTREVLSLVAWAMAAVAAYFAIRQAPLVALVQPYVDKEILAKIAVGAVAFIITLIVLSVISVKISDRVVDSAAGTFDRTLGFIYGLARGLVLVSIAYLFYGWLQPPENQEDWIRNAQSLPIIRGVSEMLVGLMPADVADTLSKTALNNSPSNPPAPATGGEGEGQGYSTGQTQSMDNLVEGQGGNAPAQPQTAPVTGTNQGTNQ